MNKRYKGEIQMAELKFSKLKLKVDKSVKTIPITSADGEVFEIEVLQYLPLEDKIKIVTSTVNGAVVKGIVREELLNAIFVNEVIQAYTNLSFTEKMLANQISLYDILESNDITVEVIDAMEKIELEELKRYIKSYSEQLQKALVASTTGYQAQVEALKGLVGNVVDKVSE